MSIYRQSIFDIDISNRANYKDMKWSWRNISSRLRLKWILYLSQWNDEMIRTVKQRKPLEPICSIVYVEISAWPGFRISTAYSVSGPTTVLIQKIMAFPRMLKSSTVRLHPWTGESHQSSEEQSNLAFRKLGAILSRAFDDCIISESLFKLLHIFGSTCLKAMA